MLKKLFITCILVVLYLSLLTAERIVINENETKSMSITLIECTEDYTILKFSLNYFEKDILNINDEDFLILSLSSHAKRLEQGNPELPLVARSLMIPADKKMNLEIIDIDFTEFIGNVLPSKGNFSRTINPADIPYIFSETYKKDEFYPKEIVELGDPFIMREIRGIAVRINPFTVNPVKNLIRYYKEITLKVYADGADSVNIMASRSEKVTKDFIETYRNHFINYEQFQSRYEPLIERGSMLVISYGEFINAMQPFIEWKNQKGIPTTIVNVSSIGTTAAQIQSYITDYYYGNPDLAYVHFVGDHQQVPSILTSYGVPVVSGGSDPRFGMIVPNANNPYPDIFISRFSAENVSQVQTQVERVIHYERDIEDGDWLSKAVGIASHEGPNGPGHNFENDQTHMENIRQLLLNNGYTQVDQLYATFGATATSVTNSLNQGRGLINYVGHGSDSSWGTTGFSISNVNLLTNLGKLPFIFSVACVNGRFTDRTCFAEAWLRATDDTTGRPTGAVAVYMSSVNQDWHPPMWAQDHGNELLASEAVTTIGGLFFGGGAYMLDIGGQGTNPSHIAMMRTWNIFGDASMQIRSAAPIAMNVIPPNIFLGLREFVVEVDTQDALISLYHHATNTILATCYSNGTGYNNISIVEPFLEPTTVTLTVTAFNRITYIQNIDVLPNDNPYIIFNQFGYPEGQSPDSGQEIVLNITLNNIGTIDAENITSTLFTTDQYVTIVQNTAQIDIIEAYSIYEIQNTFILRIANNVPDQHVANLNIRTESGDFQWVNMFPITLNAPIISSSGYELIEIIGNGNNIFDPGETIELKIPFTNTGHAPSSVGNIILFANNHLITIEQNRLEIPQINANNIEYISFILTASENINSNSQISLGFYAEFLNTDIQSNINLNIGLLVEDFSTGDFSLLDWIHTGHSQWSITDLDFYEGQYSIISGSVSSFQTSGLELDISLNMPGTISFWYKVSSLVNIDKLQFRINNMIRGDWHGEIGWTYFEDIVPAGNHTLKWLYLKGSGGSSGQDCAWIDFITFPPINSNIDESAIFYTNKNLIEFFDAVPPQSYTKQFKIINLGNNSMHGMITVPDRFGLYPGSGNQAVLYSINANSNTMYTLVYRPINNHEYRGFMTITSNDQNVPEYLVELVANNDVSDTEKIVNQTKLHGNYPNPFNPYTSIHFSLARPQKVEISVYNIKGQFVKTIVNEVLEQGNHILSWDGTNANNIQVSSGVYFYKFATSDMINVSKMMLLK